MATGDEDLSLRSKRLTDVQRGTHHWRALDTMASSQWTAHADFYAKRGPQGPSLSCDLSPSWKRSRYSMDTDVTARTEPPSYVISDVSMAEDEDDDRYPSYRRLPMVETGHLQRPPGRFRAAASLERLEDPTVNVWNSREAELEAKLIPDPLPRVIRPRQPIVMSRVGGKQGRQLRTMTDFRSRNGTVRVIQPLESSPYLGPLSRHLVEAPDPEEMEREQTYVMLRRIDKILHPERMFARADRSSSELEVIGSESSSLTEVLGSPDVDLEQFFPRHYPGLGSNPPPWGGEHVGFRPDDQGRHAKPRDRHMTLDQRFQKEKQMLAPLASQPPAPLASRRGGNGVDVPAHQRHQHARPEVRVFPTASLDTLVRELDRKEMDSYQKCQYWIDKCMETRQFC